MSGMLAQLRRLGRDKRGAIAVVFALLFPVLIGIGALGIETGIWYTIKRHNQSIADIAAYSGAFDIASDSGDAVTAAKRDAQTNGFDFADVDGKNTASTVTVTAKTVTVTLRHQQTPMLVRYFQPNAFTIINRAVASVDSTPSCASSVGKDGTGLALNGGPLISMPGCTITSNSKDPASIDLTGNAVIDAFSIYTAGGVVGKGNSTLNLNVPFHPNAAPLPDKYCLSASNCVSVPSSVTSFTMPTLLTAATTFPTLPTAASAPPNNIHFAAAPSSTYSASEQIPPTGNNTCVAGGTISNMTKSCYTSAVTLTGSGNQCNFASNSGPYYFYNSVTITGSCQLGSGVDIYVASGSLTVSGGSLTVAKNGGKSGGSKAGSNIWVNSGSFDASGGTVTFNNASPGGDTTNLSAYAIQASTGIKFGNATFNSGLYSFYGSGVTVGGPASATRTALGPADYYVDTGGFTVASNLFAGFTANVTNPVTGNATNLTINGGNLTSNGTLTFNNSGVAGVSYSLQVPNGSSYGISGGSATFGGNSTANTNYGLYGGGLAIAGANVGFNAGVNFYLDAGSLAVNANGCAAFQAGTSTINVNAGSLTSASTGSMYFNPNSSVCGVSYTGGATQYTIKTGGANGVTLGGPATFNSSAFAGTYYFMSGTGGTGLAVNAGTSTFAGGIYSVQNGNFSVASGATASFAQASAPCAPTGGSPPAGSCLYVKNGGFSNAGTATFATGNYYLYDPNGSGTTFTNSGTLTLGTTASSNFYINNTGGAFSNTGTINFGAGNYHLSDGNGGNSGNDIGGFSSAGTLNFRGSSFDGNGLATSNYYFYNGPAFGTGNSQSCSNGAGSGNPVYGALSIQAGSTGNFGPGDYYAVNGALCINQTSGIAPTLTCGGVGGGPACAIGGDGVTFILTGSNADNISTLQVPGPITSSLSAPGTLCSFTTPGCYQGLLFFQDADRVSGTAQTPAGTIAGHGCANHSNCSFLDGGDNMGMTGAIYVPQSVIDFKSNNSANTCLVIIAEAILFSGNSTLTANNCAQDNVKTLLSTSVSLTQ